MALNLRVFSANYKRCATNYKVNGASHDDKNLRATAPFYITVDLFISILSFGMAAFAIGYALGRSSSKTQK